MLLLYLRCYLAADNISLLVRAACVSSASCTWRPVLALSTEVGILNECLVIVRRLFVPTSSAGQTSHPFYWCYWSPLNVASFSLLAGISVAARESTRLSLLIWATLATRLTSRQAVNIDMIEQEWWKADAPQINIFAACHHSEICHRWNAEQHRVYRSISFCSCSQTFFFYYFILFILNPNDE